MPAATRGVKKETARKPVKEGGVAAKKIGHKASDVFSVKGSAIPPRFGVFRMEPGVPKSKRKEFKIIHTGEATYAPRSLISIITGSPEEVIKRTRDGLPSSVLGDISVYLDMPQTQLYDAVGVSRSTIAARIKGNQPLSAAESDKVVRIARVLKRASEVLDDKEQARVWLRRDIRSIGGVPPITMLDTEAGYELVMDTLGRIEQGIAA